MEVTALSNQISLVQKDRPKRQEHLEVHIHEGNTPLFRILLEILQNPGTLHGD